MDIMCLMGLFPENYSHEIQRDTIYGIQNAANKLQWELIKGLDQQPGIKVRICNSLYIGSFPKRYKKPIIPSFPFSHAEGADDINLGFLNLPIFKQISRFLGIRRHIFQWLRQNTSEEKVLLVYGMTTPFVQTAAFFQKRFPSMKICIIVPDLPEYMNMDAMHRIGLYAVIKRMEILWLRQCCKRIDYYVLLTEAMKTWFSHNIHYVVTEGMVTVDEVEKEPCLRQKSIIYAGGIKREYGVAALLKAFIRLNPSDWALYIYGTGPDMAHIRDLGKKHGRIRLMGECPNDVVTAHQKVASLLVNPRKNLPLTKYSFPSKILEYMASGTPMLGYRLDGIPEEYSPYYYRIPDEPYGLETALKMAMSLSDEERCAAGKAAQNFAAREKSPRLQTARIVEMLSAAEERSHKPGG